MTVIDVFFQELFEAIPVTMLQWCTFSKFSEISGPSNVKCKSWSEVNTIRFLLDQNVDEK